MKAAAWVRKNGGGRPFRLLRRHVALHGIILWRANENLAYACAVHVHYLKAKPVPPGVLSGLRFMPMRFGTSSPNMMARQVTTTTISACATG